ncbi:MAG: hypothetical protein LBH59_00225 [Planctomycetaceae bacterium]|nr:hypothetical protein [Planctomycetaceae bacterium]
MPELLNARKERGVETDKKLKDNYKELWGEKEYLYRTGYIFIERALGMFPLPAKKMDKFGDYQFAADLQLFCQDINGVYLKEKYCPNKTVVPLRFVLSQNIFLHDMLYWEWEVDEIKFHKLETASGMILSIIPKDLDVKKEIGNKKLEELLLNVTEIPPPEVKKMMRKSPPILKEGTVFSNVENLQELVTAKLFTPELENKFPLPRKEDEWSRQLVGFISKDAVCLIIVHRVSINQYIEPDSETILGSQNWLSGRILQKDGTPVLPHGVKEMPEWWKPILEENARIERVRLEMEKEERIEETQWRVWHDKNGQPLLDGRKMKFEFWDKRPTRKDGIVTLKIRDISGKTRDQFPLNDFSNEDKKLIIATPPEKWEPSSSFITLSPPERQPKKPEPKEDDIE